MSRWMRLPLLIVSATAFAGILRAQTPTTARPHYTVGVLSDNFPYAYFPANEVHPVGFAVELLQAIVDTSQLDIEWVVGGTLDIQQRFQAGEIDALIAYAYSAERAERFAFTRPYLEMSGKVFVRPENAGWDNLSDLRGRRVLVHRNSLGEQVLREQGLAESIVYADSVNAAMHRVSEGDGDATLVTILSGASIAERDRLNLVPTAITVPDYDVDYCIAVQKSQPDLLATLDESLAILYRNGSYETIYRKWFGRLEPRRFTPVQVLLAVCAGLVVALVVAMVAAAHQRRLRRQLTTTLDALTESEQHFREVFDATPIGLLVVSSTSSPSPTGLNLDDANPAAHRLFGWREPPFNAELSASTPVFAPLWEGIAAVRAHTSPRPADLRIDLPDAPPLHLRWSAVRDDQRILVVIENTTAQVRATEELRASERHLQQTQKLDALGNLSSGIAHDFNNVLTSILGNIELLRLETAPDSSAQELTENILRGSRRARDLVRQILTFSRQSPPERKPVDLREIIGETLQLVRAAVPRSISLPSKLPASPCVVSADGTQIHQVILNLITNAAQAIGDAPGEITVTLEERTVRARADTRSPFGLPADRYHCITVSDTGPGMPAEVLQRAMEPFYTTKQQARGTGLGLSVAHGVVTQHGGMLRLESTPGEGTRAEVWLPISAERLPEGALDLLDIEPVADDEPLILVIDDEHIAAHTVARMLKRLGAVPDVHENPLEALAKFHAAPQRYRAVLCDLSMPERSGLEVLREIRATRPDLPTLLMTGFWSNGSRDKARDLGVNVLCEKPLSITELHAYLTLLLER
ncbi:ATP-binding protein [Actomonas aquatica]|uniref:histidine kinase n=1 Tax=Actomonas aquatica TaxID=2866162 RepID=A0ABZ1CBE7_9BACT|nr:transporter substrate-binding domain-containing protein [Opitutus sp. WL0086]WRQ89006.1 transporter substrate-binding domain-containing protein [Opitutus sp. WL0086]